MSLTTTALIVTSGHEPPGDGMGWLTVCGASAADVERCAMSLRDEVRVATTRSAAAAIFMRR